MGEKKIAPYGSWKSPVTSDLMVSGAVGLGEVALDGEDIYWIEGRPSEGGRNVIVRRTADGKTSDVTPPPFNARTRVHEYGGGAYIVSEGTIYFSNFADQRLYRQAIGSQPEPLTTDDQMYYADGVIDRNRSRIIAVREDHTTGSRDATNTLVAISLETGASEVIVSGNDFYSTPRISPDGERLCWLTWNHPRMPWEGTELWVASLNEDGALEGPSLIAGGVSESVFQPEWSPDGALCFISDRTGWWNLYRWEAGRAEALTEMSAEFGVPQWAFRMSTYAFESASRIICAFNEAGRWRLASLDTKSRALDRIETPYTEINNVRARRGQVIFCGGSPTAPLAIIHLDLAKGEAEVLRRSTEVRIDEGYLSLAEPIEFPTENNLTAHGFFYAPKNRDYAAAAERPPLLVMSHGGPTSAATMTLKLSIQYWTSRGIAVLDVNYGGSTGYGRAYRERLNGQWGIVDVADCVNGARFLVERGLADGDRLIIRGGSAGGYTTLAALTFRDEFKAGASYYGISDLEALEQDCHKFESRYNTNLIGPYPANAGIYTKSDLRFISPSGCRAR